MIEIVTPETPPNIPTQTSLLDIIRTMGNNTLTLFSLTAPHALLSFQDLYTASPTIPR